jgi:hypothetical protein
MQITKNSAVFLFELANIQPKRENFTTVIPPFEILNKRFYKSHLHPHE